MVIFLCVMKFRSIILNVDECKRVSISMEIVSMCLLERLFV